MNTTEKARLLRQVVAKHAGCTELSEAQLDVFKMNSSGKGWELIASRISRQAA